MVSLLSCPTGSRGHWVQGDQPGPEAGIGEVGAGAVTAAVAAIAGTVRRISAAAQTAMPNPVSTEAVNVSGVSGNSFHSHGTPDGGLLSSH